MKNDDEFLLPLFRPKFGRSRRAAETTFRRAVLRRAGPRAAARAIGRAVARSVRRARIAVRAPGALSRRVVVKAHIATMSGAGAKAAALHLRYIERDGVAPDGSPGVLYGPDGPRDRKVFEPPIAGEPHQFRLIVAPEDAGELELTALVRELMARVEKDTGRRLEWAAVNHHDTAHPHAHVVIRGVDRQGHEVRFDRAYISRGIRWQAQDIVTGELGPRTERDLERLRAREVTQDRVTGLDRELVRRARDGEVVLPSPRAKPSQRARELHLVGRLEHLERLGLAQRRGPSAWALSSGWTDRLRELGVRGDVIQQMHRALAGDAARYRIVDPGQKLDPLPSDRTRHGGIEGRIASKGVDDDLRGGFYAVVETPAGGGYRVPLGPRSMEELQVGDLVAVSTRPTRATGKGDPDAGENTLRHRVVVHKQDLGLEEQVACAGPVWLDRMAGRPLAPYGLGAEVAHAIERRASALRELGIESGDATTATRLSELERRRIGQEVAERTGRAFVAETPRSFAGRLELVKGPSGTEYAVIASASRLVVIEAGRGWRPQVGREVALARDTAGRLHLKGLGLER